jgi:hypothetical protein
MRSGIFLGRSPVHLNVVKFGMKLGIEYNLRTRRQDRANRGIMTKAAKLPYVHEIRSFVVSDPAAQGNRAD